MHYYRRRWFKFKLDIFSRLVDSIPPVFTYGLNEMNKCCRWMFFSFWTNWHIMWNRSTCFLFGIWKKTFFQLQKSFEIKMFQENIVWVVWRCKICTFRTYVNNTNNINVRPWNLTQFEQIPNSRGKMSQMALTWNVKWIIKSCNVSIKQQMVRTTNRTIIVNMSSDKDIYNTKRRFPKLT